MNNMFAGSKIGNIGQVLQRLDTSNVKYMAGMFMGVELYDTSVLASFNTANVINMNGMFLYSKIGELDLRSFDTSNVVNMELMFKDTSAYAGYARTQKDADRFNNSSFRPSGFDFEV